MKLNQATVDLVKQFEGLELASYLDPVGVLTIGYGYTNRAGYGPGVKSGDVWTEDQAEQMLIEGLEKFGQRIIPMFKRKPTSNQYGAMLSLAYNIGTGEFSKSTCLRRFNSGDFEGAAEALTWFNKAGGRKLRGLVRRREAERALFLTDSGFDLDAGAAIQPDPERSLGGSTTIQTTILAFFAMLGQLMDGVKAIVGQITEAFGVSPEWALTIIAGGCLVWVFRERIRKFAAGDR